MSVDSSRNEDVLVMLRRLEQYSTLSPFCRLFYRLIYDLVEGPGLHGGKLRQAFLLFLRCECRRHQAVSRIVRRGKLDLAEILNIGRAAQSVLERLRAALELMEMPGRRERMIKELILAECNFHLGATEGVIKALRRAIGLGCRHPLAHFAVGYNLYASALKRFTRAGSRKGEIVAVDMPAFASTCRAAISAFRKGLGDEAFDAQLHWWIGVISEMIGERASARRAYRLAMHADPQHFTEKARAKLRVLRTAASFERDAAEEARLSGQGPITEDEIEAARKLLCESEIFPDSFLE